MKEKLHHLSEVKISFAAVVSLAIVVLAALIFSGCTDDCETSETYVYYEPVYTSAAEVRASFAVKSGQALDAPGKIYRKDQHLFINELGKGIHIYNNQVKEAPVAEAYIEIPGNYDLVVIDNTLYADSFVDLLVIDISDLSNIRLVERLENVIDYVIIANQFYSSEDAGFVTDIVETKSTQVSTCDQAIAFDNTGGGFWLLSSSAEARSGGFSRGAGLGGSLARFTLSQDHLYIVDDISLHVFDIATREKPTKTNTVELGWGIETIFPYGDHLFVGASNGMHILDNSDPANPSYLSAFNHAAACDPVAVQGDYAYVTLRSGNECLGFTNQLDVIDISVITNPRLVKTYAMQNPHGLGIDNETLFLCEGEHGLKVFDLSDLDRIDQNLLSHVKGMSAFDVIPIDSHLLMVGDDGLYQFDYADPANLKLLSIIPIGQN